MSVRAKSLRIHSERVADDTVVVSPRGEIDAYTAPQLRHELARASADGPVRRLVVDLSGVTFIDSSGLGVLIGALRRQRERDGSLAVVLPPSPIRRIFEITALDRVLTLCEDRAQATAV